MGRLGYDPLTNDFKVVVFTPRHSFKEGHQIGIYSLINNSWKAITKPNLLLLHHLWALGMSINVNNFIHWSIGYENSNTTDDEDELELFTGIIAFDISMTPSVRIQILGERYPMFDFTTYVEIVFRLY
ncbi:hypothetical protein G4B88_000248 [Cannabis sativa]|uniref:F-box protein n=1 Tax=Cannabis sativa TaxID=3483 RepID=A0A7J6GPK5_CANSA|nr:hypothetical protein G4B88_000248 [Cannabis sativa]